MRGGWGEAEIVWFESGCVICRAADHAEAIGHRPQAIPVDGMFSSTQRSAFSSHQCLKSDHDASRRDSLVTLLGTPFIVCFQEPATLVA